MGYFGNLARALIGRPRAQVLDVGNMSPDEMRDFLRIGGSHATVSGVAVNETSAMRVAAAWRCVNILAGAVASAPLDLLRRESEAVRRIAADHPLRKVLTVRPNHWQTPNEFRRMMQAHLLLRGNAYALKVRVGPNISALLPLHPDRVTAEQAVDLSITYKVTTKSGAAVTYGQGEMFHLRGLSLDGFRGLSVLSHMRESLGLALAGERTGAELMRSGQVTTGVYKHPGQLSLEAYARLKKSMDERRSGGADAGESILLEEGMSFEAVSMSAADMQFLQMRDFQRYDIAMFFGVPPHMIGATEKTTSWGSGIEAQGIAFVTYTLNDWLRIWEEAIKRDLISEREWPVMDARFYTQGLMRGDVKARWESYVKAMQWGVMSPNEVRALEDMNPRDGGDIYYDPPNTAGGEGSRDESQETA